MALMASAAASVRNVTYAHRSPPLSKAHASCSAAAASASATTGTRPPAAMIVITSLSMIPATAAD